MKVLDCFVQQLWQILEYMNAKLVGMTHYKSNNKGNLKKQTNSRKGCENNTKSSQQKGKKAIGKHWSSHINLFAI